VRLREPLAATVVTCAFLHLAFVCFLFGNEWSWLYYSAILVCGLGAVVGDPARSDESNWAIPVVLAALAVIGQILQTRFALGLAVTWSPSPATGGLYADPADAAAWERVREIERRDRGRVMVFGPSGGGFVVFPEVDSPRVWFLLRSTATPSERERVKAQLRAADWLVVGKDDQHKPPDWPEFQNELKNFQPAEESASLRLLQRKTRP
jgi:hypothetical protein